MILDPVHRGGHHRPLPLSVVEIGGPAPVGATVQVSAALAAVPGGDVPLRLLRR